MDPDGWIDSNIAVARYEAAKSFDLEDDLEYCPALSLDEVLPTPVTFASALFLSEHDTNVSCIGPTVLRRYNCEINVLPQCHATLATVTIRYSIPSKYLHPPIAASSNSPAYHE